MPVEDISGSDFQQLSARFQPFGQAEFPRRKRDLFRIFHFSGDFHLHFAAGGPGRIEFAVFRVADTVQSEGIGSRSEFHGTGWPERVSIAAPAVTVVEDSRSAACAEITGKFIGIEFVQRDGQFGAPAVF